MTAPIKVLIVEDSAFARKVVRELLSSDPDIQVVGTARDGMEALEMVPELRPDVITCDLNMPRMNGVSFVQRQMARHPVPILILSAAAHDASEVIGALHAGAIDVVRKPTAFATDDLRTIGSELLEKVRGAASSTIGNIVHTTNGSAQGSALPSKEKAAAAPAIVVIGISTGGPQALRQILPQFPKDFSVPIAVVLHMPVGYTALYAEKLNELCALEVKEAAEGDEVRPGRVLLASAGRHLVFRQSAENGVVAQLTLHPIAKIHRPSVDVLFRSAAEHFRERVLAVVMTGMGDDGKEGAAWIKAQGGTVITEAERSCVIYGMPRSVVEAGLSDFSVPLEEMTQTIVSRF